MTAMRRRASYGVDAPLVLVMLGTLACGYLLAAVAVGFVRQVGPLWVWLVITAAVIAQFGLFLYATRRGKFRVWDRLLGRLALRGDERLLDIGCGRGAVLIAAARRLPEGCAVGVDSWRTVDRTGKNPVITERNAVREGVGDRVELRTGEMTDLPFTDGEFDVVVSSLAFHRIPSLEGRTAAVCEALRVLRPGGRIVLVDTSKAREYHEILTELGARAVTIEDVGWEMWWGGPWMPTRVVSATAPNREAMTPHR